MIDSRYVHGYSIRETVRLADQASTLSGLLHRDTFYPPGSRVLECGCGTGAQTIVLAAGSPEAQIVSIDIAPVSIEQARRRIETGGHRNVTFQVASIFDLPFEDQSRHSRLVRCM
jgi:ubiquinone/menaquinone biosynthesis C-methylase UbiE